jgi:hypothetical protein
MKHTDHGALTLVAAAVALEALAFTLRPVLAHTLALLLTIAGWRPATPSPAPRQQGPALPADPAKPANATATHRPQLQALPVRELRQLARAAGHRALARRGRRADLLAALALA